MKDILNEIISKSTCITTTADFNEVFDKSWNKAKKSFCKLEVEQYYKCDINEIYYDFINSKYDKLIESLIDFQKEWTPTDKIDFDIKRIHIVEKPIK